MSEYLVASMHHLLFTTSCAQPHLPTTTAPSPHLPLLPAFCALPLQPISASPLLLSTSTAPPDLPKTAVILASLSLCPMDRSHQRNRAPTYKLIRVRLTLARFVRSRLVRARHTRARLIRARLARVRLVWAQLPQRSAHVRSDSSPRWARSHKRKQRGRQSLVTRFSFGMRFVWFLLSITNLTLILSGHSSKI